jgi:hypothetical protein
MICGGLGARTIREPHAPPLGDPVIVEQRDDVLHDDVGFVRAVVRFFGQQTGLEALVSIQNSKPKIGC